MSIEIKNFAIGEVAFQNCNIPDLWSLDSTLTTNQDSTLFTNQEQVLRNRRGKPRCNVNCSNDSDITDKEYGSYIVIDSNLRTNTNVPSPDKHSSRNEQTDSVSFDLNNCDASQSFRNVESSAVEPPAQTVLKCQDQSSQDQSSKARLQALNSSTLSTLGNNDDNKVMQGSMFSYKNNSPDQPNYSMADFQDYPPNLLSHASYSTQMLPTEKHSTGNISKNVNTFNSAPVCHLCVSSSSSAKDCVDYGRLISTDEVHDYVNRHPAHRQTHSPNGSCLCPHIRDSNSNSIHTCQLGHNIFDKHISDTSSFTYINKKVTKSGSDKTDKKKWEVMNIGETFEISDYIKKEWKGETDKAVTIRKGYEKIPSLLNLSHIRKIRGDNYCGLRSSLYSVLINKTSALLQHLGSLESCLQKLDLFPLDNYKYLNKCNFANRISHNKEDVYSTIRQCVRSLYQQIEICRSKECLQERREYLINLLNSNPDIDLQLLEAVKCLMMINAIQYYEKNIAGEDVPVFVWLLFARDTSDTPERFLLNHMNNIGDSGGLEQIEMFLLGHTLGAKLTVVRPYLYGKDDYITHFPDDQTFPQIFLIAEDDRHYNVLDL